MFFYNSVGDCIQSIDLIDTYSEFQFQIQPFNLGTDPHLKSTLVVGDGFWDDGSSAIISGTQNRGTEPYKAVLGTGFPLHKPYIQLIYIHI